MNFVQQLVNKKINNITPEELVKRCKDNDIPITYQQAQLAVQIIRQKPINIYDPNQQQELLYKVASVTDKATANKVKALLEKLL